MGSPVTLSGFNQIDFNQILNAIMQQERIPVVRMEGQRKALEAQKSAYATLASKLAALESAAADLRAAGAFESRSASVSDQTRLTVNATSTAPAGAYEVVVEQLAKAQVTTSSKAYADADTTVVASGGRLTFGGVAVTITGNVTLQGVADAINQTADVPVVASVVKTGSGYKLMLTGRETGAAGAFAITNNLTIQGNQNNKLAFSSTNDQNAQDARARFNNVTVTSSTNTFESIVPGVSFTALRADSTSPVVITIRATSDSVKALVEKVVAAFRELTTFLGEQAKSTLEADSIGRDPLVRGLRRQLASILTGQYGTSGYSSLAQVGFEFTRAGEFTFDASVFEQALASDKDGLLALFRGSDGTGGAFGTLVSTIAQYTTAGGLVPGVQNRLSTQLQNLATRIADFEERLEIRREALQREFVAADQAMAQLNAARSELSALGGQFSLF